MKRNHKWADMIRRWLDDDSLEVEYRCPGDYDWRDISGGTPTWHPNMEYRFKPKMIKVNGYEFPEPMRVAPAIRQDVWLTTITGAEPVQWSDNPVKEHWLKLGLIHDYKAAAEAHARALISLTEVCGNEMATGWDNGLCQDYDKKLGKWFANRLGARQQLREMFGVDMTIKMVTPREQALEQEVAALKARLDNLNEGIK